MMLIIVSSRYIAAESYDRTVAGAGAFRAGFGEPGGIESSLSCFSLATVRS